MVEMRQAIDEVSNKPNYQNQMKPYAKQYPNQSNEGSSNVSSTAAPNIESDKRSAPSLPQQQVTYLFA